MKPSPKPSPRVTAELVRLAANTGKGACLTVTGASMQPWLRAGMVVKVEPLALRPRIGDILVFRSRDALVAHRLTNTAFASGERTGCYLTAGDARPECVERVPPHLVVGRVGAVYASAERGAQRVDGARFRWAGVLYARTRAVRAAASRLRRLRRLQDRPPLFAALRAATQACERGAYARGFELIGTLPRAPFLALARRHRLGGILWEWLVAAERAGVAVPADLAAAVRRMRLGNALQSGRVLASMRAVRDVFDAAGLPHIFLKGGARLAASEPAADAHFSGDVDVLVPAESADMARDALRAAGYARAPRAYVRSYGDPWHHHCEALWPPGSGVPVEIHFALAASRLVSRPLTYAELHPFARRVASAAGIANVLDEFGSALHLAYHARDLHPWRDIVLLSRLLRSFEPATRARFDACIAAERTDGLRLRSAVAAADAIASATRTVPPAVRRYLSWADLREVLPRALSCDVAEALAGRCPMPKLHLHPPATFAAWLRCWLRNLLSLPVIVGAGLRAQAGRPRVRG